MKKNKKLKYYNLEDFHKSFGRTYHILFILSPKGIGKTYSAIKLCFKNWEKNNKSFAYVFRYQVEIDAFINELKSYLDNKYYIKKEKVSSVIYDHDTAEMVGILTALSQAHYVKNIQSLDLIIFDEVISATSRYLPNELKQFYLLISNLIRTKTKWNVYMLGNFHGADNPYFNYFKMFQWKTVNNILTDGDIAYVEIKEDAFKDVINSQGANFLTKYDDELNQRYIKGGFTVQDLNMIQQFDVQIVKTLYSVVYRKLKIYVNMLVNGKLYFCKKKMFTDKEYALTYSDGLDYNNIKVNGKDLCDLWSSKIFKKQVVFENFDVKNAILEYLSCVNLNFEHRK